MAYPTIAELKSNLRITDGSEDSVLTAMLNEAIQWVKTFTGRDFSGTAVTVTDEEYDLDTITQTKDSATIQLRQMDITELTSVSVGGTVIDSTSYKWSDSGRLIIYGRIFDTASRAYNDFQVVKVSYKYGAPTNLAINGAIVMLAMSYWNDRLAMANTTSAGGVASEATSDTIKSEKIGEYAVNYGGGNQSASKGAENLQGGGSSSSTGTINSISRMLNTYRKRRT